MLWNVDGEGPFVDGWQVGRARHVEGRNGGSFVSVRLNDTTRGQALPSYAFKVSGLMSFHLDWLLEARPSHVDPVSGVIAVLDTAMNLCPREDGPAGRARG